MAPFVGLSTADLAYHRQNQSVYCGPAVAETVLRSLSGVPPPQPQEAIYAEILRNNVPAVGGGTTPTGMAVTLNGPRTRKFAPQSTSGSILTALPQMVPTLQNGIPVPLFVDANEVETGHWITVSGIAIDTGNVARPRVAGFYTNDPEPASLGYPASNHYDGDTCGSGEWSIDAEGHRHSWTGITNVYWTPYGFQLRYSAPPDGFTAVTDTTAPGPTPNWPLQSVGPPAYNAQTQPHAGWENTMTMGLVASGIGSAGAPLARFLGDPANLVPGTANPTENPLFGNYFQVALMNAARTTVGWALIDVYGNLLAVQACARSYEGPSFDVENIVNALSEDAALSDAARTVYEDYNHRGRVRFGLVWRPCREAPSPFYPLLRLDGGNEILYRSADGRYHRQLHRLHQ